MATKERKSLKKGIDFDNAQRRRSNQGIQIRKNRRMEGLQKRRSIHLMKTSTSASASNLIDTAMDQQDGEDSDAQMNLPQFLSHLNLTTNGNTTIPDPVIELLTKCTTSIATMDVTNNYIQCSKPGNNVSATTSIKDLVEQCGIVPLLVANLRSDKNEIREQSAICLGNIAGEMPALRDYVIQSAAISPM